MEFLSTLLNNIDHFLIGGMIFLSFYHVLLYFQRRFLGFLFYALQVLAFALFMLVYSLKLEANHPVNGSKIILLCLGGGFYFLYAREILTIKKYSIKWSRYLYNTALICFIFSLLFVVIYYTGGIDLQNKIYSACSIIYLIFIFFLYKTVYKIKSIYSKYFLMGSLIYVGFSSITLVVNFIQNIFDSNFLSNFNPLILLYFGIIGESIIFALLIGFKYKEIENEKRLAINREKLQRKQLNQTLKEQDIKIIDSLMLGKEKERETIAYDLHDNVGSSLTALKFHVDSLGKKNETLSQSKEFEIILQTLNELGEKIRNISHIYNHSILHSKKLIESISELINSISVSDKISFSLNCFNKKLNLTPTIELTVFRIIQELISNILKHSKANVASISLLQTNNNLNIIIEDDGIGFINKKNNSNGIGLSNIINRVELIKGEIEIDSQLNKGTTIIIDIPL